MLDAVSAHVELIERHNILRVIVQDAVVCAELAPDRFLGGKQIAHLNVQLLTLLVTHKVDLLVTGSSDCHIVIAAQKLKIDDVLQNEIDVAHIAAEDSLTDAVVGNVILLV